MSRPRLGGIQEPEGQHGSVALADSAALAGERRERGLDCLERHPVHQKGGCCGLDPQSGCHGRQPIDDSLSPSLLLSPFRSLPSLPFSFLSSLHPHAYFCLPRVRPCVSLIVNGNDINLTT